MGNIVRMALMNYKQIIIAFAMYLNFQFWATVDLVSKLKIA